MTSLSHHRRALTIAGILLAVAIATATPVLLRMHDNDSARSAPDPLSGDWIVTSIDGGSAQPIVVPREIGAEFSWTPAGPQRVPAPEGRSVIKHIRASVDASDGATSYGCYYDRDGDRLTLHKCLASLEFPLNRTALQQAVAHSFEQAFREREMPVASTGDGDLAVTLGRFIFTLSQD